MICSLDPSPRRNSAVSRPADADRAVLTALDSLRAAPPVRLHAPAERQKIIFVAAGTEGAPAWVLDGKPLSAGPHASWDPSAGRHTVELRDRGGRLLDAVVFQVRDAVREGS